MKLFGSAVLLSVLFAANAAAQNVWYVDVTAPPGGSGAWWDPYHSIQYALDQPTTLSGDGIRVAPGVYWEQVDLLGKEVHIGSTGGAAVTKIHGGWLGTTIEITKNEGPLTLIEGFTITGGVGQPRLGVDAVAGGVFVEDAYATFKDCVFEDNQAQLGGGILVLAGHLGVTGSTFVNNRATIGPPGALEDGDGGAIWAGERSTVMLLDTTFTGNIAGGVPLNSEAKGGAIYLSESELMVEEGLFAQNIATCNLVGGFALGGAICAEDLSTVEIADSAFLGSIALADTARGGALYVDWSQMHLAFGDFDNNIAGDFLKNLVGEGGAIHVTDSATSFVERTWFTNNQAQYAGGAVYGIGGYEDCEFWSNQSHHGGAAYASEAMEPGSMYFDEVRFLGNVTSWGDFGQRDGGAVYGPAFVRDSDILDNVAHGKGGGAFGAYLWGCTIDGNSTYPEGFPAVIKGGGAHDCEIYDSVVSNNSATGNRFMGVPSYGGGVCSSTLLSTEVWGNTADFGGGAANSSMDRTTFNANVANIAGGAAWFAPMMFTTYYVTNSILWGDLPNEIHDAGGLPAVTWTDVQGGWPGVGNASSDPFWFDGTNHDYYLLATSPCIDAGDPLVSDPDGSVVDMGAHPYDPLHTP